MVLYHVTDTKNIDSIRYCGIQPVQGWQSNNWDCRIAHDMTCEGIYGFTTIDAAIGFGRDHCYDHIAIYSFDADENDLVLDPEYSDPDTQQLYGTSYFLPTESGIDGTLIQVDGEAVEEDGMC